MKLDLTLKSLNNRKFTTLLCLLSIGLSVTLFLAVEKIRQGAEDGFTNTISQTDLIVGARSGQLQLLLYSVFQMGQPTNNISYSSYEKIKSNPYVEWAIPISLGDSYRGFRVVGTDENFFQHYRYRGDRELSLEQGHISEQLYDVVLGASVAAKFGHKIGDHVVLSHGISEVSILEHNHSPFTVVGILNSTQTPVDRGVYITLQGLEAIHVGWETGSPNYNNQPDYNALTKENVKVTQLTAFYVRNKSRILTLRMQRFIQDFSDEPLMGIIPALALQELWQNLSYLEKALQLISTAVLIVGLLSVVVALYTSLNERRREMAILRSLGMGPAEIFFLLLSESVIITVGGMIIGIVQLYLLLWAVRPWLEHKFSVYFSLSTLGITEFSYLGAIFLLSLIAGLIPAWKAYRQSLADGLTIRL